jgi:hypothetical protein
MAFKTKVKPESTVEDLVLPVLVPASTESKMVPKPVLTAVELVQHVLLVSMVFKIKVKLELTVVDLVL